jgi:DNA-binding IclR family transcriptional regulator
VGRLSGMNSSNAQKVGRGKARFKPVGSVASASKILLYLSNASHPQRLTQISRELKLNTSTCLNILRTLAEFEFVDANPATKTYAIGFGIAEVANKSFTRGAVLDQIRILMSQFAQRHKVTVTVWERSDDAHMTLSLQAESRAAMRIFFEVGQRLPVYVGAMGRVMAAHSGLSTKALRAEFKKLRWQQPIDFDTFAVEVKKAAQSGWAVDPGNFLNGTMTISAPILDQPGPLTRVCSATSLMGLHDAGQVQLIAKELIELSRKIARLPGLT